MSRISTAAIAVSLAAAPVFAGSLEAHDDPVMPAPFASPATDAGDWSGAYAGAHLGWGDVSVDGIDGDATVGGLQVGYNWDLGPVVLGAEIDYEVADIDFGTGGENLDSHLRAKLRAGHVFGRSMVYVAGGVTSSNGDIAGADRTDTGWFGGIGMARQVTQRWVIGAEFLEHRFEDFDGTGLDISATTAATRLSYRF